MYMYVLTLYNNTNFSHCQTHTHTHTHTHSHYTQMGQSTAGKQAVVSMQQKKDVGYQSVVVGGKVQRVLMPVRS